MADLKKSRIVIASVLKPVNDTRMTEKIAVSLASIEDVEVHVIGFPANFSSNKIIAHALHYFKRLSFARLLIPWRILSLTLRLKPSVLIIATHELLGISLIARMAGCKVIYDVQENYYRNILYTNAFPFVLRPFLAAYVRGKEYLAGLWINHFFIAERAYAHEVAFLGKRFTLLENKVRKQKLSKPLPRDVNALLFSGTIAETTGVFRAIEIAVGLHRIDPAITLTIIGYCPQAKVLDALRKAISDYPFIRLIGGDVLVPHDEILKHLSTSGAGIINYTVSKATENSVPTKFYEYLGAHLPIILVDHKPWVDLASPYHAAVVFRPDAIDYTWLLSQLRSRSFYITNPVNIYWEDEEGKLKKAVKNLLD